MLARALECDWPTLKLNIYGISEISWDRNTRLHTSQEGTQVHKAQKRGDANGGGG